MPGVKPEKWKRTPARNVSQYRHTALKSLLSSSSPTLNQRLSISETHLRKGSSAAWLSTLRHLSQKKPALALGAGRAPDPRLRSRYTHRAAGCATTASHPPAWHRDSRACSNFYRVSAACLFPAATTPYMGRDSEHVQEAWDLIHNAAELQAFLHRYTHKLCSLAAPGQGGRPPGSPSLIASAFSGLQFSLRRAISTRPCSPFQPPAPRPTLPGALGRISCHFLHSAQL